MNIDTFFSTEVIKCIDMSVKYMEEERSDTISPRDITFNKESRLLYNLRI